MIKSIKAKFSRSLLLLIFFALFCCLVACGGSKDATGTGDTGTTTEAASINLSASPTSIKSDGSITSTITVVALNSSNAALSGVTVTLGTDNGVLSAASVITNSTTSATATLSTGANKANCTATVTATAGNVSAQIPIQITGSTVMLESTGTSLPADGSSTVTMTATAKDASGNTVSGTAVTFTSSGAGSVTITPASGTTDNSGMFTATVTGTGAGTVTITATALGATSTTDLAVGAAANTFAIDQQTLDGSIIANETTTAMKINDTGTPYTPHSLIIRVYTPTVGGQVTFATSIGVWDGGSSNVVTKTASGNEANATLTSTQAGVASVQVYDSANQATNDTLTVAISSGAAANKIILQAAPTVVPVSVGTTTGSATLTATVYDVSNNPRGGIPVAFSIINPTSGGEKVSPVVVMTADTTSSDLSLGQARASFTSGSMPSGATGIQIRASVVGTSVQTNTSPSGNDVKITIGGVAGSIAFGQATVVSEDSTKANYGWPWSILVADSNGNAVSGAVVSLSLWPIAWSTGSNCWPDADGFMYNSISKLFDIPCVNCGTFYNEDLNENLILDFGEDGNRIYYYGTFPPITIGTTQDGQITPTNSAGGTVPATVTTDANGVAGFTLTYPKNSAIWTLVRIRATTIVQGSETRGEIISRLVALDSDANPCKLINLYKF